MYCRGNPIKYSDPNGYEPQPACDQNPNWESTEYEREKAREALGVMKEAAEWGTLFIPGFEEVGAAKAALLIGKWANKARYVIKAEKATVSFAKKIFAEVTSKMKSQSVKIGGKGCTRKIDDVKRLVREHGGKEEDWVKKKAINKEGDEVHWYERNGTVWESKYK